MKINIIDPSSTEFNRGSFCYAPYLCYNALSKIEDVILIESFQPEDIDTIPDADIQLVCLWSYPQIDCAIMLAQLLPFAKGQDNVYFVGYTPLIEHLGLRHIKEHFGFDPLQSKDFLLPAMINYPINYSKFERLLLSDCDMHLKSLQKDEKVYPLFTSYGCPNNCVFCPSTTNCGKKRITIPLERILRMLDDCLEQNIRYIHFTDEDFFYDSFKTKIILNYLKGKGMHLIALGSAWNVQDFITKYGSDIFVASGLEVIEIGFESASTDLSQNMGYGKSLSDCKTLAKIQHTLPCRIFWLVQTFFLGETITTLNETGRFMRKYGFEQEEVMGRLRTNGTKGGLGQFFQPYHGTPIYKRAMKEGLCLTSHPVRLIPSYIPDSFLDSIIQDILPENFDAAIPWLKLYNVTFDLKDLMSGRKIRKYIENKPTYIQIQLSITFAVLARMEVIK